MRLEQFITKLQKILDYINEKDYDDFEILVTTNKDEYIICNETAFIGGLEDTLMCDVLGNVAYSTIESIGEDLYEYLSRNNEIIIDVMFIWYEIGVTMLKDLNFDEIQKYFKELDKNPGIQKAQLYRMAKAYSEIQEKEAIIRNQFTDKNWYLVREVFVINDDYQIAEVERKDNKEILYFIFINYKPINECAESFDRALIAAVSYKYSSSTMPAMYYAKMIDMKYETEKSEWNLYFIKLEGKFMKIKSITFTETGKGVFFSRHALVETEDGQKFVYVFEYNEVDNTWKDEEDYLDNVRSDFERESDADDFAKDDMGLFYSWDMWVNGWIN